MRDTESEHSTKEVVDIFPANPISTSTLLLIAKYEIPVGSVQFCHCSNDERKRDVLVEILLGTGADV